MDKKPQIFYEIELKSVFNKAKYDELDKLLNSDPKFKLINKESITTNFYKDQEKKDDVRLRLSDKTIEFVYKKGCVTKICRKEVKIPLGTKEQLEHFIHVFDHLPIPKERGTLKHKQEFLYRFNDYDYIICLQYIENFAYILEIEYLGESEAESEIHEPNLRAILQELNLKPIDDEKFLKRLKAYISGENTLDYEC